MTDLSDIEQLPQPDVRGVLALRYLPPDIENAENATQANDYTWRVAKPRGRLRPSTPSERLLLEHLGHGPLPADLETLVTYPTRGVRRRTWPSLGI
jgi:hypothetical protein